MRRVRAVGRRETAETAGQHAVDHRRAGMARQLREVPAQGAAADAANVGGGGGAGVGGGDSTDACDDPILHPRQAREEREKLK
jgi:hypothetical protein